MNKQSRSLSIFTTFLLSVGLLTFTPSIKAEAAGATCVGATCSQSFTHTGSVQQFTPTSAGTLLTITAAGAGGGHGGADAGGGGGAGYGGTRITFQYVTTSASPLYLYIGSAGGNGSGGSCSGAGAAGVNPWTAYNGGRGGLPGCSGSSGAGGGGGSATVIATGDKSGVIAVAGGGGGGGGANIGANGTAGKDDTGTQVSGTTGANGGDWSGDGSGGGGGGGGLSGGTGGAASSDGWNPGGAGGVTGKYLYPGQSSGSASANINTGAGTITISWPNGPSASTRPSFTDSTIAKVGQVLTPVSGSYAASAGTVTVSNKRWQISTDGNTWTDISPIVSGNYTISTGDVGKYVRYAEDATDSNSTITWGSLPSLQITAAPVFTAESPTGTSANTIVNTSFAAYTFAASGYRDVYSISSGALPAGITINPTTGVLSGTATATGTYKYKVKVTNEAGFDETVELSLVVGKVPSFTSNNASLQAINRITNPFRVGSALTAFTFEASAYPAATFELKTDATTIPACGTYPGCAYSYETIGLPNGVNFDPSTGIFSGTPTKTGAYVFAIKATNSLGSAIEFIHMTVAAKAPQPFTLSSDKNAVTIIQGTTVTATVTASGGDGTGAYSFAVDSSSTTICSIATASANSVTMTVLAAGNCVINGTKAADATYASSKASITIAINKAFQSAPLVVTGDVNPVIYGVAGAWVRGTGGSGTGAFSYTIDPSSSANCSVNYLSGNNVYLTIIGAGNCLINATKAGDGYFQPQTTQYLLIAEKKQITGLAMVNPATANWNATTAPKVTLNYTGGQGTGAITYNLSPESASVCTLANGVLTAKSAGVCNVSVTKAGDANYIAMTSPVVTWTINQIAQPALSTTGATIPGVAIAFNSTYNPYIANPDAIAILTTTGGAGTGSYSYSVTTGASNCYVSGAGATAYVYTAATGTGTGWCYITITKAADINYTEQSTTFNFHIGVGNQSALVVTADKTSMDYVATTALDPVTAATDQLTVTGGLGTGAVSYAVASGSTSVCSVNATTGLITDKTAGSCVVNITKAADSNYAVQTASITVTFNKLQQEAIDAVAAADDKDFVYSPKATIAITTSGGTGTGAISYVVDPSSSSVCSVNASSGLITDITAGTCVINITKAGDTNYQPTTDKVTVEFNKIYPAAISLTASPASVVYTPAATKNATWVTVSGGLNSTGAFTFYVDPMTEEYCSIVQVRATQVQVSGNLAGFCLITVVQAADVNYFEQRTLLGIQITKAVQTIGATSQSGTSFAYKDAPTAATVINVTGQAGTGATHYVVDSSSTSGCSVDQSNGNLTSTTVGTCKVTVSRDGDDNVQASNSIVLNLTITKATQAIATITPNSDFKLSGTTTYATSPLVWGIPGTGTGTFTSIVSTTTSVCTITGGGTSSSTPVFTATLTPSITVTGLASGTCTLQYTKSADSNYNVATNFSTSFIINKASQAEISSAITVGSASMPYVASPKATATIASTGGSGTGVFNYTVDPSSSTVCSVNLTTGVVTDITAGTCLINVKRLGDANYTDSTVKQVTVVFTKVDQAALTLTANKLTLKATTSALDSATLTAAGGLGTGTISYTIDPTTAANCSISGTTVTGTGVGECKITATKAADVNYNSVSSSVLTLTIQKGVQATLSGSWWIASVNFNHTALDGTAVINNYLVTSGGSGSGELIATIDPASTSVCKNVVARPGYPLQMQITAISDGVCSVTYYKSGGTAYENSNTVTASYVINKISQTALTATASKSSLGYFGTPPNTFTVSTSGGSGTGALSIVIAAGSSAICADATPVGGALTIKTIGVGNCNFTVTKAASAGYNSATSASVAVTITKGTQVALVATASPNVLTYQISPKVTSLISVTGGSGNGAITTTVDSGSSAICSYNDSTKLITALQAGKCEITVTKLAGADGLFLATTTKLTVVINKIAQAPLTLTAVAPYLKYSENPKAGTSFVLSGGTGTGAVSYSLDSGSASTCNLTVTAGIASITANYFGYCVVNVVKAGDNNYAEATASATVRIAMPGTDIGASVPSPTVSYLPAPGIVSVVTVDGSQTGDILTYTVDTASKNICSAAGNGATANITSLSPGLCNILVINVHKSLDGTLIASSATVALSITKGEQTNVVAIPATESVYFATPAATDVITVTGGISANNITASVSAESAANCSVAVVGNKVTMTALRVGDCVINITKAGDANYNDYSTSLTIPIFRTKQAALVASKSPAALVYNANSAQTSTITATGGSGTGAISYELTADSATICSLNNNVITAITGGDCVVKVTKAGDVNYAETSIIVTVNIAKANQSALSVSATPSSLTFDAENPATAELSITGGSGQGEVGIEVAVASQAICEVIDGTVVALRPGNCVIIVTKQADPYFNSATATVTVIIAKSAQQPLIAKVAPGELVEPLWNGKNTTQIIITGGNGYGALQLTGLTPSVCSVLLVGHRVNVTGLTVGDCKFSVLQDGDYAYLASASLLKTVTVASAPTDLVVKVESAGKAVAGGKGAIDLILTNAGPAKADGATVLYTLPTGVTALSPLSAGCSMISSTEVKCVTTKILEASGTVRFTIPVSLAASLTGGVYTVGGQAELSSATPDSKPENNSVSGEPANFIVNKAPIAFNKTAIGALQTGQSFSDQLIAVAYPAATYTISAGDLPAGLTLNPATGEITGIPTGVGKYAFTVSAYNSAGAFSQAYTGTIAPAPFVTTPANGFATNTVPAGTKVTIGGLNLDLITGAIIGGKTVKIASKTSAALVLEVPSSTTSGEVSISLIYAQGSLDGGTFTYTGVGKLTPVIELDAGETGAGAGEDDRTLAASITATGIDGEINLPVVYTSKTATVCKVTGDQLSFLSAGTCTLVATTAANTSFNAATSTAVTLTVTKSGQTLDITLPKDTEPVTAATDSADGFDLQVETSSGLAPVYVSATPSICDVTEDGHVTGLKVGHCVINVSQPGNARFNAIASSAMEFDIVAESGAPAVDNGDPLHPTSLANGALNKMGDVGFTWNKKLAALSVETYGIWIGKINAVSEFTISGKTYKCSVDFGILKAMPSKTAAQLKAAMAKKVFKASAPFCNAKTEATAYKALKAGYVGLNVKVVITRYRMYPTTYLPINAKTKKKITTQVRTVYLTLG